MLLVDLTTAPATELRAARRRMIDMPTTTAPGELHALLSDERRATCDPDLSDADWQAAQWDEVAVLELALAAGVSRAGAYALSQRRAWMNNVRPLLPGYRTVITA